MKKVRFVTTLEPDVIKKMKIMAANQDLNVNEVIKKMVEKKEREERDKTI